MQNNYINNISISNSIDSINNTVENTTRDNTSIFVEPIKK